MHDNKTLAIKYFMFDGRRDRKKGWESCYCAVRVFLLTNMSWNCLTNIGQRLRWKVFRDKFGNFIKSEAKILAIFFAKLSGAFELYFHTNFSCSFSLICDATNVLKSRDLTSIKRNFFKFMNEHDEKVSKPHVQFRPFSLAPAWLRCLRKMFNINSRNFKLFTSVAVVQPEATQRNFPILRLNSSEWWE